MLFVSIQWILKEHVSILDHLGIFCNDSIKLILRMLAEFCHFDLRNTIAKPFQSQDCCSRRMHTWHSKASHLPTESNFSWVRALRRTDQLEESPWTELWQFIASPTMLLRADQSVTIPKLVLQFDLFFWKSSCSRLFEWLFFVPITETLQSSKQEVKRLGLRVC